MCDGDMVWYRKQHCYLNRMVFFRVVECVVSGRVWSVARVKRIHPYHIHSLRFSLSLPFPVTSFCSFHSQSHLFSCDHDTTSGHGCRRTCGEAVISPSNSPTPSYHLPRLLPLVLTLKTGTGPPGNILVSCY